MRRYLSHLKPLNQVTYGSLSSSYRGYDGGKNQALECAYFLGVLRQVVRMVVVLVVVMVILFKLDLSFFDFSGQYGFEVEEWFRCGLQSFTGPSAPYMATAYQLPQGIVATVVLCPPCRCKADSLILEASHTDYPSHYQRIQAQAWRTAEAAMGSGDFTADVWIFHWKAQEEHMQLSIGDRLKLGSLEVPVIAAPSIQPSTGIAPQLAVCTGITSGTSLDIFRQGSSWFEAWVAHHFSGMQEGKGYLYFYAPDMEQQISAVRSEVSSAVAEMNVYVLPDVQQVLPTAWDMQRQEQHDRPKYMRISKRDHVEQVFFLQDCLYRAKAAGIPWLFQADGDEILDFGQHESMAGLLAWAVQQQHDAITFGSHLHSVQRCVGLPLANFSLGPAEKWQDHFPCQMPLSECTDSNAHMNKIIRTVDMGNDCLGPRGRRKYLIRPTSTEFLKIHTPPVWRAYHMGHAPGDAVIRHYQGLLNPDNPCQGDSASRCQVEWCQTWRDEAVCQTASS